jgi:hypothetical protein
MNGGLNHRLKRHVDIRSRLNWPGLSAEEAPAVQAFAASISNGKSAFYEQVTGVKVCSLFFPS